jgi:hypothetical protein
MREIMKYETGGRKRGSGAGVEREIILIFFHQKRTHTVASTLNPVWNYKLKDPLNNPLTFNPARPSLDKIRFIVWDAGTKEGRGREEEKRVSKTNC